VERGGSGPPYGGGNVKHLSTQSFEKDATVFHFAVMSQWGGGGGLGVINGSALMRIR
jgi:hypothetical protein